MTKIRAGLICGLLLALAGCGGSSSKNDCGDVAKKMLQCIPALPATEAEIKAACESELTCPDPGRQNALDCIMGLTCNADFAANGNACISDNGCASD
jgi:hypothetical protein